MALNAYDLGCAHVDFFTTFSEVKTKRAPLLVGFPSRLVCDGDKESAKTLCHAFACVEREPSRSLTSPPTAAFATQPAAN